MFKKNGILVNFGILLIFAISLVAAGIIVLLFLYKFKLVKGFKDSI